MAAMLIENPERGKFLASPKDHGGISEPTVFPGPSQRWREPDLCVCVFFGLVAKNRLKTQKRRELKGEVGRAIQGWFVIFLVYAPPRTVFSWKMCVFQ